MSIKRFFDINNKVHAVLIIDDSPGPLVDLVSDLHAHGVETTFADTIQHGLKKAQEIQPDVILLRIPTIKDDSFNICKQLTTSETTQHTPVIIISEQAEIADKIKGFEAGATDYVGMPFENEELLIRIATHLRTRQFDKDLTLSSKHNQPQALDQISERLTKETRERQRIEEALRASEEKFRSLADHALIGIFIIDHNHQYSYVNDPYCRLLGYSPEKLIGADFRTLIDKKQQFIIDIYWQHYKGKLTESRQEFNILQPGGEKRRVELISTLVKDIQGRPRTMGQLLDVTDRREAEAQLRFQANLLQQVSDAIIGTDLEFNIQSWNKAAEKVYGWSAEEILGQKMGAIIPTHYPYHDADKVQAEFLENGFWEGEVVQIGRNGQRINILATVSYLKDKNGNPIGVVAANKDITNHKQIETNKALLQGIIDNTKALIHAKDLSGHYILLNHQAEDVLEKSREKFIGKTDFEIFPEETATAFRADDLKVIKSGEAQLIEEELPLPNGPRTYVTLKFPLYDTMGKVYGTAGISTDITERKEAELELRSSREMLALSQEMANLGSWEWDVTTGDIIWSEEMCRIHGITPEQFPGTFTYALEFIHPDDRFMIEYRLKNITPNRKSIPFEYRIIQPDGIIRNVVSNGQLLLNDDQQPLRIIGTCLDITERKQVETALQAYSENLEAMVENRTKALTEAQEKLVRQEKLAFLGQLAGGVGHELRNPLGVINNAIFYLKMIQPEADDSVKSYLDMIEATVQEAEKIIADLLSLSRTRKASKKSIGIETTLTQILAHHPPPDDISIVSNIPSDLSNIHFDALHLKQILTNLLNNAYQAMPEGGTLTLNPKVEAKNIVLTINDTGVGVAPGKLEKIFEPLFTTKSKGIGLGLAVVKNLIELNGGSIAIESTEGQGTTFTLTLPKA